MDGLNICHLKYFFPNYQMTNPTHKMTNNKAKLTNENLAPSLKKIIEAKHYCGVCGSVLDYEGLVKPSDIYSNHEDFDRTTGHPIFVAKYQCPNYKKLFFTSSEHRRLHQYYIDNIGVMISLIPPNSGGLKCKQ